MSECGVSVIFLSLSSQLTQLKLSSYSTPAPSPFPTATQQRHHHHHHHSRPARRRRDCRSPSMATSYPHPIPRFPPNSAGLSRFHSPKSLSYPFSSSPFTKTSLSFTSPSKFILRRPTFTPFSGGGIDDSGGGGHGGGGGGDSGGDGDEYEDAGERNRTEAILALTEAGRSLETIPNDLAAAIQAGRIPGSIVRRFFELETTPFLSWLLRFGGFKERLLADDLFITKVAIECGVGIFTKTAAELEKRRENFTKELDFVLADVVMAIIADFMLVWLPAPTVSLRPPVAAAAGNLTKFFHGCPDNAFQVALAGTSYSLLQRIGSIFRNGTKLFVVGTGASLVGTGVTNLLIVAREAINKSFAVEAQDVPILSTSAAYGVYMAVSSNLRYQILAGIIEQRILEPLLHEKKLVLSAVCFCVRTGNTFLGSLMWVDYARWVGVQKISS